MHAQIQTDDGAVLYMTYGGVLELTPTIMQATQTMAEESAYEDQYFRTTPRLETGDDRYTTTATRGSTRPCSSAAGASSHAVSSTRSTA